MTFEDALAFVLEQEGGLSNHPLDPGGLTKWGITQATYSSWRKKNGLPPRPVSEMTEEEMRAIYRALYWDPIGGDSLPPPLALAAFDSAVNSGVGRAREWLEQSGGDWRKLIALRLEFMTGARRGNVDLWATFGRGWARRISRLLARCAELEPPLSQARRLILLPGGKPQEIRRVSIVGDKLYVALKPPS